MVYDLKKELRVTADSFAKALSFILLVAVCLSFLARHHWIADLFSHFLIQYVIGATVLGVFYALTKKWLMASVMLAILTISLIEISPFAIPTSGRQTDMRISIMQYNRLIYQTRHDDLMEFLKASPADIITLQEAGAGLNKLISTLQDIYPYRIVETRAHAFGMVILSRHKIIHHEVIPLNGPLLDNILIRAEIDVPDLDDPLILYALHTLPPTDGEQWQERNTELVRTADLINKDKNSYIILAGDWNITPYSPFFKDLLKTTGLEYQNTSLYPPMT